MSSTPESGNGGGKLPFEIVKGVTLFWNYHHHALVLPREVDWFVLRKGKRVELKRHNAYLYLRIYHGD